MKTLPTQTAKTACALTAAICVAGAAFAAPTPFSDGFDGPIDPAWSVGGDLVSHPAIAGTYDITDAHGGNGNKVNRSVGGALDSYTHTIDVVLNPFLLSGSGGTQADFKWRSSGVDGSFEVLVNSFGDMRLSHNDYGGSNGAIVNNTNIGLSDGDDLHLAMTYDAGTDAMDVTYSINGAPAVLFYSGNGISGDIGDVITNIVEVEVFKWGSGEATQGAVAIDHWSLGPVPEPSSLALLALGGIAMMGRRRR